MADALCGPSNALQSFQKQTSLDRTLQQDRLVSRQSPHQSFRSSDQSVGLLDPEFDAFQSSQPSFLPFAEHTQLSQLPFQTSDVRGKAPAFESPLARSEWATDFQRMHISQSPGQPTYMQGQYSSPAIFQSPQQVQRSPQNMYGAGQPAYQTGFRNQFRPTYGQGAGFSNGMMQQQQAPSFQAKQADDVFDDGAFERAFDEARAQMLAEEQEVDGMTMDMQENLPVEPLEQTQVLESSAQVGFKPSVDVYPQLAMLRTRLLQCLVNPTESSIHDAALYLSLLEQHDIGQISNTHAALFLPLLSSMAYRNNLPYEKRYDLKQRARTMIENYKPLLQTRQDAPSEQEQALTDLYNDMLQQRYQTNHLADASGMSATDAEMRADIETSLASLSEMSLQDRVFSAVPRSREFDERELAQFPKMREIVMAEANITAQQAGDMDLLNQVMENDNPWLYLLDATTQARYMPEALEAAEFAISGDQEQSNLDTLQTDSVRIMQQAIHQPFTHEMQQPLQQPFAHNTNLMQDTVIAPAIAEEQQINQESQPQDDEELAKTAGELLEKISGNQTTKFQNSAFLGLMRKLRDREVRVDGDKMVEIGLESSNAYNASPTVSSSLQPGIASNQELPHNPTQSPRDGQAVVDLLDSTAADDDDDYHDGDDAYPEFLMTSPFYEDKHAQISRQNIV